MNSVERRCSNCAHAREFAIEDEYGNVYECDAKVFDTKSLTCFVPREEQKIEE